MKLATKQVYDIAPLVEELTTNGHAFIEANKGEFDAIMQTLTEAGHTVNVQPDAPVKQGHHFLVFVRPTPVVAAPARKPAKAPKQKPAGPAKTYSAKRGDDVFTGTLTDVADYYGVNRMSLYMALKKSNGAQVEAVGVTIQEFNSNEL
jgi:hypothetical protein